MQAGSLHCPGGLCSLAQIAVQIGTLFQPSFEYDLIWPEAETNTMPSDDLKRSPRSLRHLFQTRYLFDLLRQQLVTRLH